MRCTCNDKSEQEGGQHVDESTESEQVKARKIVSPLNSNVRPKRISNFARVVSRQMNRF